MNSLLRDIRFGLRALLATRAMTTLVVVTVALGVGANTAVFAVINGLLLSPLPVAEPSRLAVLFADQKGSLQPQLSVPEYEDFEAGTRKSFSGMGAYLFGLDGFSVNGKKDRILTSYVSGSFFTTLGLVPAAGRLILPSEGRGVGSDPVVVLSYAYWKSRFGSDPNVIGTRVLLNGKSVTIVGVAPAGFYGVYTGLAVQGYLPLGMSSFYALANAPANRQVRLVSVIARLRPDVTFAQANSDLTLLSSRLSKDYPTTNRDIQIRAFPEWKTRATSDPRTSGVSIVGLLFLASGGVVLLLAAVNVAGVVVVRNAFRRGELAVRTAVGGTRAQLIQQLTLETGLFVVAGGLLGIGLARVGTEALSRIAAAQSSIPLTYHFGVDWRVVAYTAITTLVVALFAGVLPGFQATGGQVLQALREAGPGMVTRKNTLLRIFVTVELGGALTLLVASALFARSLWQASNTDLGFDAKNILNLSMDTKLSGFTDEQTRTFYAELLRRASANPGVTAASLALSVPMGNVRTNTPIEVDGEERTARTAALPVAYNIVSSDYFRVMGIPIVSGRSFSEADDQNSLRVAIISAAMAERYWKDRDPIGRHFSTQGDARRPLTIVGVARDARYQGVTGPYTPYFYVPFAQQGGTLATLQTRSRIAAEPLAHQIEQLVAELAPDLPVFDVGPMEKELYTVNGLLVFRVGAQASLVLALLGLSLASVGVYGVIAYSVAQRTREFGLRMALGAQRADIVRLIQADVAPLILGGLLLGNLGALLLSRILSHFLTVSGVDPLAYLVASAVLIASAIFACILPARRAMRVDAWMALKMNASGQLPRKGYGHASNTTAANASAE